MLSRSNARGIQLVNYKLDADRLKNLCMACLGTHINLLHWMTHSSIRFALHALCLPSTLSIHHSDLRRRRDLRSRRKPPAQLDDFNRIACC